MPHGYPVRVQPRCVGWGAAAGTRPIPRTCKWCRGHHVPFDQVVGIGLLLVGSAPSSCRWVQWWSRHGKRVAIWTIRGINNDDMISGDHLRNMTRITYGYDCRQYKLGSSRDSIEITLAGKWDRRGRTTEWGWRCCMPAWSASCGFLVHQPAGYSCNMSATSSRLTNGELWTKGI